MLNNWVIKLYSEGRKPMFLNILFIVIVYSMEICCYNLYCCKLWQTGYRSTCKENNEKDIPQLSGK